jgi:hypothetical protein
MSHDINPYNSGPSVAPSTPPHVGNVNEVAYELDVNDLIAFSLQHQKRSPTIRRQRRVAYFLLPAVLFAVGALMLMTDAMESAVVSFVLAAVLLPLGPWLMHRRTTRIMGKLYAEGSNRALMGWRRLSIGREGVEMKSELVESRVKWLAIEKIESSNEYLFMYIGSMNAHMVPMRAFGNEMHFSAFVETARGHWRHARDAVGPTA